jgi:hypothetical protein
MSPSGHQAKPIGIESLKVPLKQYPEILFIPCVQNLASFTFGSILVWIL